MSDGHQFVEVNEPIPAVGQLTYAGGHNARTQRIGFAAQPGGKSMTEK
jgi:hypothetical protein